MVKSGMAMWPIRERSSLVLLALAACLWSGCHDADSLPIYTDGSDPDGTGVVLYPEESSCPDDFEEEAFAGWLHNLTGTELKCECHTQYEPEYEGSCSLPGPTDTPEPDYRVQDDELASISVPAGALVVCCCTTGGFQAEHTTCTREWVWATRDWSAWWDCPYPGCDDT